VALMVFLTLMVFLPLIGTNSLKGRDYYFSLNPQHRMAPAKMLNSQGPGHAAS
jgi:hypothetical protein